jgi:hypothetical protein
MKSKPKPGDADLFTGKPLTPEQFARWLELARPPPHIDRDLRDWVEDALGATIGWFVEHEFLVFCLICLLVLWLLQAIG